MKDVDESLWSGDFCLVSHIYGEKDMLTIELKD